MSNVSTEQLNRKIFLSYFSYVTFPLVPFQKLHAQGQSQCCPSICGVFQTQALCSLTQQKPCKKHFNFLVCFLL